jgi:hypothetical protein
MRWTYSDALAEAGAFVSNRFYFTNKNVGYFIGIPDKIGKGIILKTNDGGLTWYECLRTSASLNSVCFNGYDNIGITIGEHGTMLKTINAGGNVPVKQIKMDNIKINIYPNPTSDYIRVSTPQAYLGKTTYFIFDCQGRTIKRDKILLDESYKICISNLKSGNYLILMLLPNGTIASGKFIVK